MDFKKELKIGDKVALILTTGKEPTGIIDEIGDDFVLIRLEDGTQSRIFDRLIGGWTIISRKGSLKSSTSNIDKNELLGDIIDDKIGYKEIENEINEFIRTFKFDLASKTIDKRLKEKLPERTISNLLLKKAQLLSSQDKYEECEATYIELIEFNKKYIKNDRNISHLLTEVARLQSVKSEKRELALKNVVDALKYNPQNNYAESLLKKLKSNEFDTTSKENMAVDEDKELNIELPESDNIISPLVEIDILEHKYTSSEIIKNFGKSSPLIATQLLKRAKDTRDVDFSERYPVYLEAAKAFSELNIGSYNTQDYIESIAFYSMLKGNSLFYLFKDKVLKKDFDIINLTRLKDSACSYLKEALNFLTNIKPELLLGILNNYLKLNIIFYYLKNNITTINTNLFKEQFADLFSSCIRSTNKDIERIVYDVIITCGSSSFKAWNQLLFLPKGTGILYAEFKNEEKRKRIFLMLNELNNSNIDISIKPGIFIKEIFIDRRKKIEEFQNKFNKLTSISFEPLNFNQIKNDFEALISFKRLLNDTDIETYSEISSVLTNVQPYLNRSELERTNILLQCRSQIEKQLLFISKNSTYFNRTLFSKILNFWKSEVDNLLNERIVHSFPILDIQIDPPYIIRKEDKLNVAILIKNTSEITSEGYNIDAIIESVEYEIEKQNLSFTNHVEIPSSGQVSLFIPISNDVICDSKAVEICIEVSPIYQNKILDKQSFEFTLEIEPDKRLTYEQIPWKDGPIPSEQMFKGRRKLIYDLTNHYLSIDKDKPYILYGLTRTGKSSILEYLKKQLHNEEIRINGVDKKIITFLWDFSEAASQGNAKDFYNYILYQNMYERFETFFYENKVEIGSFKVNENTRFKDFKLILEFLNQKNLYPIIFIDEFSFIKNLMDAKTIDAAFLHSIRQYSLNNLASFIFSGTYDIKKLLKDPKYGITGQLVNAIEHHVNEITDSYADELMSVMAEELRFTPEAKGHIMNLSGNIPYFIQIICKNCGYYASENKRSIIGYPELEEVISILIGIKEENQNSLIKKLPENIFQNNQFSPQDPKEVLVLVTSIAHFNKGNIHPRGVGIQELEKFWADQKLTAFRPKLAEAIKILKEKKILIQQKDEHMPVYILAVDLFRRWWEVQYPDINLELSTLIED